MKKLAAVILALLFICSAAASAEVSFEGEALRIDLPSPWFDATEETDPSDVYFMNLYNDQVLIWKEDLSDLGDMATVSGVLDVLSDEIKQSLTDSVLESLMESMEVTGEIIDVDLPDGIFGSYASTNDGENDLAVAVVLGGSSDVWDLISFGGYTGHTPEDVMLEAFSYMSLDGVQPTSGGGSGSGTSSPTDAPAGTPTYTPTLPPLDNTTEPPADMSSGESGSGAPRSSISLAQVPLTVRVSETDMNLYTTDTPAGSLTLSRSSSTKQQMDEYVSSVGASLVITHPDDPGLDFEIQIRVKEDRYTGVRSWTESTEEEIGAQLNSMYGDMLPRYSIYRTDTGVFAAFALTSDSNAFRYATIYNGDMIYIHGKRNNGPLTEADRILLKLVVDSTEFE